MTDAEISRRLALAIGWRHVKESVAGTRALVSGAGNMWHAFDYRDPAVIWPIAERFDCFPMRVECGWGTWSGVCCCCIADTAAKAVALAVIKHHEGSKTA